jgi:hypothetical protein
VGTECLKVAVKSRFRRTLAIQSFAAPTIFFSDRGGDRYHKSASLRLLVFVGGGGGWASRDVPMSLGKPVLPARASIPPLTVASARIMASCRKSGSSDVLSALRELAVVVR